MQKSTGQFIHLYHVDSIGQPSIELVHYKPMRGSDSDYTCIFIISVISVTWDQAQFSFRFLNNIPVGKAKRT